MESITANEIAGLGFGALLFCAAITAPKLDALISASQRSSLGMCKRCGDLKAIACSRCKGVGLVKEGSPFGFTAVDDFFQSFGDGGTPSSPCTKCKAKGRIQCPNCFGMR